MRGLEEIRKINENPGAHYASREPQHFGLRADDTAVAGPEHNAALQRILDDITGGKPKSAADATTALLETLLGKKTQTDEEKAIEAIGGMLATAMILDALGIPAPTSRPRTLADRPRQHADARARNGHLGMDGILSAIDAEPPFLKFWQKLNDERAARGQPEAGYKDAKEAFLGGPTPDGALTFIGAKWEGLRAVPAGDNYHAEFRTVSDAGTVWHIVSDRTGPRVYTTPEAALGGALIAKRHSEEQS